MKRSKPLTREQYLKKFSRAVRWRLPPRDAEEAIADYRELIFQEERDETKLVEELGSPVRAAGLLTDRKAYYRWQKVFAVLTFGLLLLIKWDWSAIVNLRLTFITEHWYPVWVMAVGLPLSLYWFRRYGQKNGALSKRLALALTAVLIAGCWVLCWSWDIFGQVPIFEEVSEHTIQLQQQVRGLVTAMMYVGVFSALAALAGLVLARCRDRRWLALYTLGLTASTMIGFVTLTLVSLFRPVLDTEAFRTYLFARLLPIGAIGLIGTGVALC